MKNYKIVSCIHISELEKEVNYLLNKGYECVGGVVVKFDNGSTQGYCQAMVLDTEE